MHTYKRRKMNKSFCKTIILSLFVSGLNAADGDGGTESTFSLGFGARAIGMGQAFTALADDPTAVFWNPAGLEFINQQSATFFHTTLFEGVQYDYLGYAYPTLDLGSFGIGIGRIGVSGLIRRDAFGEPEGEFTVDDYQVFFSYAKALPWYSQEIQNKSLYKEAC